MGLSMTHTIVTICGSMRFYDLMLKTAEAETAAGKIVLMPFVNTHNSDDDEDLKAILDIMHREKIFMSSEILVVGNYIGESTESEIEYARMRRINIRYTHPEMERAAR